MYIPCKKQKLPFFLCCFCMLAILGASSGLSARNATDSPKKGQGNATRITAGKMVYKHKDNQINFIDNVIVDTKDFRMKCEDLVVYLNKAAVSKSKLGSGQVEEGETGEGEGQDQQSMDIQQSLDKVVATKNVRITMENRAAQSARAVYLRGKNLLTLSGDVVLIEGPNRIRAETVRLYLDENKSEIVSGKQNQVEALIFPSSNSSETRR